MSKKKSLGINAVLNGIKSLLNLLFPLITFPYVSKVLQVGSIGKYNFANSIVSYFIMIAGLGISTYAIREGAKYRENREKFNAFANQMFSINMISTIGAYCLLFFSIILIPKLNNYKFVIIVFSVEILFTTIGTEWIYSIYEDYLYITVRSIIFKVIAIVLLFIFVKNPDDYIKYAAITVLSNVGSNLLNYIHAKNYCNIRFTKNLNIKKHIKPILIIFGSSVATIIYINSDITMLGFFAGDYEVGIYSISSKIYRLVKTMLSSILIVSIPRFSMLYGLEKMDEYKNLFSKIFNIIMLVVMPIVVGLFMLSKEIVLIMSDSTFISATSSLRLLSIALLFCIFGWLYNECVLIPAKQEKVVLNATIISAVINIVLDFALIPFWKENAVAFSTVVAEATMMIICIYKGKKIVEPKNIKNNVISVLLGCMSIILICSFVKYEISNNLCVLAFSIVISVIVYGIILVLFNNIEIMNLIKRIISEGKH